MNKHRYKRESSEMVVEHINMLCKVNNKQVFVLIDEHAELQSCKILDIDKVKAGCYNLVTVNGGWWI